MKLFENYVRSAINAEFSYRETIDTIFPEHVLNETKEDFRCITFKNVDTNTIDHFIPYLIQSGFPEEQAQEMHHKYQEARRLLENGLPNGNTEEEKELYHRAKEERLNSRKELSEFNGLNQVSDYILDYERLCSNSDKNFEYKDLFLTYALAEYFCEKLSKPENIREYFLFKNNSQYSKILKQFTYITECKPLENFDMNFSILESMINKIFPVQIDEMPFFPVQIDEMPTDSDSFDKFKDMIFESLCMAFLEHHIPDDSRWLLMGWKEFPAAEDIFAPIKEAEDFDQIYVALTEIKKITKIGEVILNPEFKKKLNLLTVLYKIIIEKYGKKLAVFDEESSLS